MEIAKLQTMTKLKIPIIVERSKKPGPTVLFRRVCMAMKLMVLKLCANSSPKKSINQVVAQ